MIATINVSVNNGSFSYTGDSLNTFIYNIKNDITKYNTKKRTVTGSFLNDIIDMTKSGYVVPISGKNKGKGLTIKGGRGADEITGTAGNDTININTNSATTVIKAGKGENTINIDNTTTFGNITLTEKKLCQ